MLFRSTLALMLLSAATLPAARAADRAPSELVLGVHHGFESTAGIAFADKDWNSGGCAGRFLRDESNVLYDRVTGVRATKGDQADFLAKTCLRRGYRVGGDDRVKSQASSDLLQFLRDAEVLRDEEARAFVPDCQSIPGFAR